MSRAIAILLLLAACHHDPAPQAPAPAPAPAPPPVESAPAAPSAMPTSEDPHLPKLREFRDRACACKDARCADAVVQDLIAYASADTTRGKPSDADAKAADNLIRAFEKCVVAAGGKL